MSNAVDLIKKYEGYISNLEWHIKTNEPGEDEVVQFETRIYDFKEVIRDLQALTLASDFEKQQALSLYQNQCNQIAKDQQEIERLKGIIFRMYDQYCVEDSSPAVIEQERKKFKSENNL